MVLFDVFEVLLVVGRSVDLVVGEVFVGLVNAQVDHKGRAGILLALELLVVPLLSHLVGEELGHAIGKVGVHHDLVGKEFTFAGANTLDGFPVHDDRFDGFVHSEGDAEVLGDAGHPFADAAEATDGVENAVLVFEEGEHREQAGAVERRHAEVLRLEGHRQHESVIVEELHEVLGHRPLGSQDTGHTHGSLGEQVARAVPRLLEAGFGLLKFQSVVGHVAAESIGVVVSGEFSDALGHLVEVARAVELAALPENEAVVQVQFVEVEFLVSVKTDRFENVLDHFGIMEKRRAEVKFETVPVEHLVATADRTGAFKHGHVDAGLGKEKCRGKATWTRTDNGHFWLRTSSHGSRCWFEHINGGFCS